MDKALKKIIAAIRIQKTKSINEAQTKDWLIRPFFESLGWDFSNPEEVIPEDDDLAGKRTDYCFYVNGKPKLLIEAKALSNPLNDNKMIIEKLNYSSNRNIPLLILTNGDTYRIYYSELKGIGKEKLLYEFTLSDRVEMEALVRLSRESFESNNLLIYAKSLSLNTTIKHIIEKIFQSGDKKFVRMVNDSVKEILGHRYGDDDIVAALRQITLSVNLDHFDSTEPVESITEKTKWTVDEQFRDGKWKESQLTYKSLVSELKKHNLDFVESPKKRYISLISNSKIVCDIAGLKSGLKIWLKLTPDQLSKEESLFVRDVSSIGHWGNGDSEFFLENGKSLEVAISLILKSYRHCTI